MRLPENIKRLCEERSWSLGDLAKKSGVPRTTLHHWTTGKATLNLEQLKRVSIILKVSVHELVWGEIDPFGKVPEEMLKEIFSGDIRITLHKIERLRK